MTTIRPNNKWLSSSPMIIHAKRKTSHNLITPNNERKVCCEKCSLPRVCACAVFLFVADVSHSTFRAKRLITLFYNNFSCKLTNKFQTYINQVISLLENLLQNQTKQTQFYGCHTNPYIFVVTSEQLHILWRV